MNTLENKQNEIDRLMALIDEKTVAIERNQKFADSAHSHSEAQSFLKRVDVLVDEVCKLQDKLTEAQKASKER